MLSLGIHGGLQEKQTGVPQGGVLSQLLFNSYISKRPTPPPELKLISYADDCTVLTSGRDTEVLKERLNCFLPVLRNLADKISILTAVGSTYRDRCRGISPAQRLPIPASTRMYNFNIHTYPLFSNNTEQHRPVCSISS